MRERLLRFMAGRNGMDRLNLFLQAVDLLILILAAVFRGAVGRVLFPIAVALLIVVYFRMFSRDRVRRMQENERYLRLREQVIAAFRRNKTVWDQRKDYKFFTCPACKTTLRVPRGKGKIKIVCRKCGNSFTGKS